MGVRELLVEAIRKGRRDGLISLLSTTINWLQLRGKRFWIRRKYGHTSIGDNVVNVDPKRISDYLIEGRHPATSYRNKKGFATKHELSKAYFPIAIFIGVVVPGEWDNYRKSHRFDRIHRGIRDHYLHGKKWEETEHGEQLRLLSELYSWDYDQQLDRCESLYQSITDNGYEPALNMKENVPVNIGRNGELIFNNKEGHHRLAFAKILNIDFIPVIIVVRHEQWQAIREEVIAADSITDLSQLARRHLTHPDVKTLHDLEELVTDPVGDREGQEGS
jgi:hypothetical protein